MSLFRGFPFLKLNHFEFKTMAQILLDLGSGLIGTKDKLVPNGAIVERYSGLNSQEIHLDVEQIRPGLVLAIIEQTNTQSLSFDFQVDQTFISITYCLNGSGVSDFKDSRIGPKTVEMGPLDSVFSFMPDTCGTTTVREGNPVRFVRLFIEPQMFFSYLEDDIEVSSKRFPAADCNPNRNGWLNRFRMDHEEQMILHRILNCSLRGAARRFLVEGSVLELLGLNTAKLSAGHQQFKQKEILLSKRDIEAIHYARDLLLADLTDPPTIVELARLSGINEFKLKYGFRKIFMTSVYRYYQKHRMEKAKLLLYEGKLNVSKIAWEIGYTNVSHFIAAYKRFYGVRPGSLLKEIREIHI